MVTCQIRLVSEDVLLETRELDAVPNKQLHAEIAPAYVYLTSQESSYVSAEILGVTDGTPLG